MRALILVDFENEWIDPASSNFIGDISGVLDKTNKLIDWARANNYKVIFTIHEELDSEKEFIPNSNNTRLISALHKDNSDIIVRKNKISPFYKTKLKNHLKGIKEIVVAGILTNLCVRSLVSEAYDRDYQITVVKDCCVSFDKMTQEFTIKDLKSTRPEIEFINLNEIED